MTQVRLFLSTVSDEFRSYRDALRALLTRPNVIVHVQEDFIPTGTETLDKLDGYIATCDAVIHLAGDMTGAWAKPATLQALKARYPDLAERLPPLKSSLDTDDPPLSYTQWEAYLAVYHRKPLVIAVPEPGTPRDAKHTIEPDRQASQHAHLERLRELGRYAEITFGSADALAAKVFRSSILDLLVKAGVVALNKPIALPYQSLGTLFKGREPFVADLRRSLQRSTPGATATAVTNAVHGLGGVGKTRLAVEYAWQHAAEYNALLLAVAEGRDPAMASAPIEAAPGTASTLDLWRNIAALAGPLALNLPEQSAAEENARVAAVLHWLQQHPGWLLIIDNADSEQAASEVEALLGKLHGGHVLITSRRPHWSRQVERKELEVLPEEAAEAFLLERTDGRRQVVADDAEQARALAKELGYLALALEQAGAYIDLNRPSFAQYRAEWQSNWDKVAAWFNPRLMHYDRSVAVTWQMSVDRLSNPALRLLQRLAWLSPEPVPEFLLDVPAADNPCDDLRAALADLETYSLVTRSPPTFTVHRLVQDVTRRSLARDARQAAFTQALHWIDHAFVGNAQDVRSWPVLDPLAPHARLVAAFSDDLGIAAPTARLMNQLGLRAAGKASYAEAEPLYQRSLAISETALGPDHATVGTSLNNLAELYRVQGRTAKAEPLYQRSLAIRETTLGPDHPDVGASLNNLAELYRAQGRTAEAEPLYQRSLAISETALGPDHATVGTSLNNLAELYRAQGRYAEAEPLYQRSLAISETALGPDHPDVGTSLNNLAELYRAQGRYAEAEPLYQRSLASSETALGPDHPDVGTSLNNLANLYRAQGRHAEAEPLYQRSLAIRETALGPDHPDVGASLNNLAGLHSAQGRTAEAEPLYQRSLAIRETALGPDHPDVGASLNNLAGLYSAQGRTAEAEPLYQRSLAISETALGPDHPTVGTSLNNLAELYSAQGRTATAEPLYQRSLAISETALGPDHPDVGASLNNLANLYRAQGHYAEAEPLYQRSLAIRQRAFGPAHPDVGASLNNLAGLYESQGRTAEAEPLYQRSLAISETALGPDHPDVGASLNNLAALYIAQGRTAEAEPLYQRSLAINETALGPDHPDVGTSLNNLAELYRVQGRTAEAEPLMRRCVGILVAISQQIERAHPNLEGAIGNYAGLLKDAGKSDAEIEAAIKALRES